MLLEFLFLAQVVSHAAAPGAADVPPDVVVFVIDDVAALDVALVDTPCIDALAASGTDFRRGYGQPMCAPARWSFLLSRWRGSKAGFTCKDPGPTTRTLAHGLDSLPKLMEAAGYHTVLVGRWGMGTSRLATPGTDDWAFTPHLWGFESWLAGVPDGVATCLPGGQGGYSNWLRVDDGVVSVSSEYQTIALREAFLGWWLSTPSPRCAVVCLQAAHKGGAEDAWHVPPSGALPPGYVVPVSPTPRQRYEAMIASADHAVGRMMDAVDLARTLVVLFADNGTPGEVKPPGVGSGKTKFSTFEGGVHVPFVVAGLGFPAGRTYEGPVSVVDVVPTLADLAGIAPRHGTFDGQSLLPALQGEPLRRPWVYVQRDDGDDRAVIEERWKLRESAGGVQTLHDLLSDPNERRPIDPDSPEVAEEVARLRAELREASR